jgi:hypothetical protein
VLLFPIFMGFTLRSLPSDLSTLARQAWLPAYSTAALLAAALAAMRLAFDVASLAALVAVTAAGLAVYWLVYFAVWLRPEERTLIVAVVRGMLRAE